MFELLQAIPSLWLTPRMSGLAANLIVYPVIMYMCPFSFFSASFDTYTKCSGIFFFFFFKCYSNVQCCVMFPQSCSSVVTGT